MINVYKCKNQQCDKYFVQEGQQTIHICDKCNTNVSFYDKYETLSLIAVQTLYYGFNGDTLHIKIKKGRPYKEEGKQWERPDIYLTPQEEYLLVNGGTLKDIPKMKSIYNMNKIVHLINNGIAIIVSLITLLYNSCNTSILTVRVTVCAS